MHFHISVHVELILTLQSMKYFPLTPSTSSEHAKYKVVCAPCCGV